MQQKFEGCLMGVAIGDAMGMPVEMLSHEEVKKCGGVSGYRDPMPRSLNLGLRAGQVTDDTVLSLAIATSMAQLGRVDPLAIARGQVEAYLRETRSGNDRGWGGATVRGFSNFSSSGDHLLSGIEKAAGNGTAMKAAPLGLWHHKHSLVEIAKDAAILAVLTHHDNRAIIATALQAELVRYLATKDPLFFDGRTFSEHLVRSADWLESQYPPEESLSERLQRMLGIEREPVGKVIARVGVGCYVLESLPFAIYCFLKHPTDIEKAVLLATNAGGDSDSTASMAGALVGALVGSRGIPTHLRTGLELELELVSAAEALYKSLP